MSKKSYFFLVFLFVFLLIGGSKTLATGSAILSLTSSKDNPAVNETFEAIITLDTVGVQTSGVDVILLFDKEKLEAQEIITGEVFPNYIYKNINNQDGKVTISGIIGFDDSPFSGEGTFAKVEFKAKAQGVVKIDFDFTPQNHNDSNVADVSSSKDVLTETNGATITIGQGQKKLDIFGLISLLLNWCKNLFAKFFRFLKISKG